MASTSRKIFIDASVLIAFIDRGASNHSTASKAIEDLASIGYLLYTSSQAVTDTFSMLSRDVSNIVALDFLQTMLQSSIEILFPQKADFITAHRILQSNRERQISLQEALNATLMQKRGVLQVLTFTYWNKLFGTYVSNLIGV